MNEAEIKNSEDFYAMTRSAELVVVTTYRGAWCPFCRKYLQELDKARKSLPHGSKMIGLSVDNLKENQSLQNSLELGFQLFPDQSLVTADLLGVATGKGHGRERYLQPSVFVYKNGVKVYEWIQEPKLMNLGGAISRLPVKQLVDAVCAFENSEDLS